MSEPAAPPATHIWTKEHKLLLCVLSRYFKSRGSKDDETALVSGAERILCRLFSAQVQQIGSDQFLSYGAVRRMIYELAKKGHPCWKAVFIDSDVADTAGTWKVACDDILRSANELSIRLVKRKRDHPIAAKRIVETKKQLRTQISPILSPSASQTITSQPQTDSDQSTQHVGMSSQVEPQELGYDTYDDYNYSSRVVGRLAFRVFTPSSHSINGRDGCYAGAVTGVLSQPPCRSSDEFMEAAYIHLRPVAEPSKFLSVTTSLLVALRLALWKGTTGIAKILTIDMGMIATANQEPSRLTPSKAIVNRLKDFRGVLQHSRNGDDEGDVPSTPARRQYVYNCISEFLVWEHIPAGAILNVVDAVDITNFLKVNPTVDQLLHVGKLGEFQSAFKAGDFLRAQKTRLTRRVGQNVGAFLKFLGLDIARAHKMANTMKSTWAIGKHAKTKKANRRHNAIVNKAAYLSGVLEGYVDGVARDGILGNDAAQSDEYSDDDDIMIIDENNSESDSDEKAKVNSSNTSSQIEDDDFVIISDDDLADAQAREPATLERSLKRLELHGFRFKSE